MHQPTDSKCHQGGDSLGTLLARTLPALPLALLVAWVRIIRSMMLHLCATLHIPCRSAHATLRLNQGRDVAAAAAAVAAPGIAAAVVAATVAANSWLRLQVLSKL
jgi:hypothetical protein